MRGYPNARKAAIGAIEGGIRRSGACQKQLPPALAGDNRPNELTDARLRSVGNAPLQDAARGDGSPVSVDRSSRMLKKSSSTHMRATDETGEKRATGNSGFKVPKTSSLRPSRLSRQSRAAIEPPYHVATLSFDLSSVTAFFTALNNCS